MKEINQCPICGNKIFNRVQICKDYLVSNKEFEISACAECGFQFTNPRPADDKLADYYKSEDYVSHSESKKGIINKLFLAARKYTLKRKLKTVHNYSTGKSILDIGCGTGSFLDICKSSGYNTTGLEPEESARDYALKNYGIEVFPIENFLSLDENLFDVITLWHVLEHVSDLNLYFKRFKELLNETGTLIIALPNRESKDAKEYGKYWAAYDVPRHLYHFRKKDIKTLAEQNGFKLVKCLPMKLDAYYVSMLSEKHKHGKNRPITAFFTGLKSNWYAKSHDKNYSSLIYIFKAESNKRSS